MKTSLLTWRMSALAGILLGAYPIHAHTVADDELPPDTLSNTHNLKEVVVNGLEGEAGMQQTWYDYNVGNPAASYSTSGGATMPSLFPSHSKNGLLSAFGELRWDIAGIVQGSAGLRANRYLSNDMKHWNLEPRAALKINMPHSSSISAGYSHIAQYAQQVSSNYIYLPSDAWLPTASCQKPLLCDIYSLGYFKQFRQGLSIKAEAWWKGERARYGLRRERA